MPPVTIQSLQERMPWLMWPIAFVDALLTPRRWAPAPLQGLATRVSAALTRDSLPLARWLGRGLGWTAVLRAAILRDRPRLQRAAWFVRKHVWAAVWSFIVVSRLWPRRTPVPDTDVPIQLLTAPDTYGDFQSPSLVVPSDMPRAEMSLPGAMIVQALHVLQDLYPVVSSHQPEAAADPAERVVQAYPWLFRLVRTPPVWHHELAEAQRRGRLLDVLAVGGPFAKLLERSARREYLIDLDYLRQYPVRDGLQRLGCRIHYADGNASVSLRGVELDGHLVTPGDTRWPLAERVALCSLATHTTVWRHGMQYHVGGVAPFAAATHQLPPAHPLARLLAPHIADTLSTNYHTHLTLRRNGFDVTGFSFDYDTILRYYDDGARYFDLRRLDPREDTARREIGGDLDYPYLGQSARYFDLFVDYVTDYIRHYYPDDRSFAADPHLRVWFDGARSPRDSRHHGVRAGADARRADPPLRAVHLHGLGGTRRQHDVELRDVPAGDRARGRARPIGGRGAGGGELRAADLVGDQPADERREPRRARSSRGHAHARPAVAAGAPARSDGPRAAPPLAHPAPRPRGQHLGVTGRAGLKACRYEREGGLKTALYACFSPEALSRLQPSRSANSRGREPASTSSRPLLS